jgi:hypothetical protein
MNTARRIMLLAAACLGAAFFAPAPAAAQAGDTPWYMPQPWMTPKSTAPRVASRPGYYGHAKHNQYGYGGFSNGCYGACGYVRGTIVTGSGVVVFQPRVVIYDPRVFAVVPRNTFLVTQGGLVATGGGFIIRQNPAVQRQKAIAALPKDFLKRHPSLQNGLPLRNSLALKGRSTPMMSRQNGVRIFTPNPSY